MNLAQIILLSVGSYVALVVLICRFFHNAKSHDELGEKLRSEQFRIYRNPRE